MHPDQHAILTVFRRNPQAVLSTTELVRDVLPEAYQQAQRDIASEDAQRKRQGTRSKGRLHRQLLYHIGKLVDQGVLKQSETRARGEKTYRLSLDAGEMVVRDKAGTVAITKHPRPDDFIASARERKEAFILTDALHKIEAYAVDATRYPGIHHLRKDLLPLYAHIEDAVLVLGFESFLDGDTRSLLDGFTELIADSKDYRIAFTLHIDVSRRQLKVADLSFLNAVALHHPPRIYLAFSGPHAALKEQRHLLERIAETFGHGNVKLSVHNTDADPRPYAMGRAGMYAADEAQQALARQGGSVLASTSVCLDFSRLADYPPERIRELAIDAAKTMLARTVVQRRLATTLLGGLAHMGTLRDQLSRPKAYLRVWNYGQERFPHAELLASIRQRLEAFGHQENVIFASCGVPLHFKPVLSSAFAHYAALTPRSYRKQPLYGRSHLRKQDLEWRERLGTSMDCDRTRVFREGTFTGADLIAEILAIMHGHDLAHITYDFRKLKKTVSLTAFMQ